MYRAMCCTHRPVEELCVEVQQCYYNKQTRDVYDRFCSDISFECLIGWRGCLVGLMEFLIGLRECLMGLTPVTTSATVTMMRVFFFSFSLYRQTATSWGALVARYIRSIYIYIYTTEVHKINLLFLLLFMFYFCFYFF